MIVIIIIILNTPTKGPRIILHFNNIIVSSYYKNMFL